VACKSEQFCACVEGRLRVVSCTAILMKDFNFVITFFRGLGNSLIGRFIKLKLPLLNYLLTTNRIVVQKTEMCDYNYGLQRENVKINFRLIIPCIVNQFQKSSNKMTLLYSILLFPASRCTCFG
jgi:hypothetical protein